MLNEQFVACDKLLIQHYPKKDARGTYDDIYTDHS